MAITVEEKAHGISLAEGETSTRDIPYIIRGASTEEQARAAFVAQVPRERYNYLLHSVDLDEIAPDIYEATAHYEPYEQTKLPQPQTGDSLFSFSTSGSTQHITQAYNTTAYAAPGAGNPPDYKGAIGVTGSGEDQKVEGVDVPVPSLKFTETYYPPAAMVTRSYVRLLATITGMVSLSPFRGFQPGEVLFLGADGNQRNNEDWEIAFQFDASPNVSALRVGDMVVAKKGWDYLWVRYVKKEDAAAKALIESPQFAYVCEVHKYANFGIIGIGT